jgi:Tfp pilus assembly protein PilN
MAGLAITAKVVALGLNDYKTQQINEIKSRYELLRPTQEKMESVVKKQAAIEHKQQILANLTEQRTSVYAALAKLNGITPSSINLTGIKAQGDIYTIDGLADSYSNLASYRQKLETDRFFEQVELISASTDGELVAVKFQLVASVRPVKK